MNEHQHSDIHRPREAPAGGPKDPDAWLDEADALATVRRLRPELSPLQAEAELYVAYHFHGRKEPPSPGGEEAEEASPADRPLPRVALSDLVRWFAPLPTGGNGVVVDTLLSDAHLRLGGSRGDLERPLVGSPAALRHVRRAHPDSTEHERKALLWEAIRAGRLGVWYPPGVFLITTSEDGRRETWAATERFWEEALFSEPTVLEAFPPMATAGQESLRAPAEPVAPGNRKGVGGRRRQYEWDSLGAAFGAWLHDEPGRDRLGDAAHVEALAELAGSLGIKAPDRTTAQPYIGRWLAAYRAFIKPET